MRARLLDLPVTPHDTSATASVSSLLTLLNQPNIASGSPDSPARSTSGTMRNSCLYVRARVCLCFDCYFVSLYVCSYNCFDCV